MNLRHGKSSSWFTLRSGPYTLPGWRVIIGSEIERCDVNLLGSRDRCKVRERQASDPY
jgi:hypothetical protein